MSTLSPKKEAAKSRIRKSMDPVSEFIRLKELPSPGDRFVIQELIGIGTTAKVYSALDNEKATKVAIKIISNVAENILEIESEYKTLCVIGGHDLMPAFYGAFMNHLKESKEEVWFVMELCKGVTVSSLLQWLREQNRRLKEEEISVLLKTFLMAIHHLHVNDMIHRDTRASNFILSPEGDVKLIDFGFCAVLKGEKLEAHSAVGACHWMAPEVITCEQMLPYSKSCDIWSLGITAIELAETQPPLHDVHPVRTLFQIARNPPPTLRRIAEWTTMFKDFIDECLVKNPEHRPCVAELLFHPFIVEADDSKNKLSLEEFIEQRTTPEISEKGKKVLKDLGLLVTEYSSQVEKIDTKPYMTFKNWHFKTAPDSPFIRVLPDDIACIEQISEDNLLDLLHQRFLKEDIYTFIGDILIAILPRNELSLYGQQFQEKYCEKARSDNAPHIYAVADRAYQQMLHHKRSQVVILFGQCSSGKSESATELINQLVFLGPISTDRKSFDMAGKIQQICPLLDAFGNAQTHVNPNASRYIKAISVTFTKTGKISGAVLNAKLLENWRFDTTFMCERNFHIFYYVYEGLKSEQKLSTFGLNKHSSHRFLPQLDSRCSKKLLCGYQAVLTAFRSLALTEEEISSIFKTIAALLLLGDAAFISKGKTIEIEEPTILDNVSDILQVNKWKLRSFLSKAKDVNEAQKCRDALALFLYNAMFDWMISLLNRQLSFSRLVLGDSYSVWVVDTPGYQSSDCNSLFELRSNIMNDLLLNRIQQHVFIKELEEYKEEDVSIPFRHEDFAIRSQELSDREASHQKLLEVLQKAWENGNSWTKEMESRLKSTYTGIGKDTIAIQHAFQQVLYKKDAILPQLTSVNFSDFISIMKSSSDPVISHFWDEPSSAQLWEFNNLFPKLDQICAKEFPHFVVCVNPDFPASRETRLNEKYVLQQIRSYSLTEMALIRKQGYARRVLFSEFLNWYKYLAFDFDETVEMTKDNCRLLLIRLKMDGWIIGKNKVFLKYYAEEYLSRLYEMHVKKIVKVQAMARRFLVKVRKARKA